jgi:6-phosphofructokinase
MAQTSRQDVAPSMAHEVIIGGNGSRRGALTLFRLGFPAVGVASTIDNDLYGSEITVGVETARQETERMAWNVSSM